MVYISSDGNVAPKKSWCRLGIISDAFWGLIGFVYLFASTLCGGHSKGGNVARLNVAGNSSSGSGGGGGGRGGGGGDGSDKPAARWRGQQRGGSGGGAPGGARSISSSANVRGMANRPAMPRGGG